MVWIFKVSEKCLWLWHHCWGHWHPFVNGREAFVGPPLVFWFLRLFCEQNIVRTFRHVIRDISMIWFPKLIRLWYIWMIFKITILKTLGFFCPDCIVNHILRNVLQKGFKLAEIFPWYEFPKMIRYYKYLDIYYQLN